MNNARPVRKKTYFKKKDLPFKWRGTVVKMLADKGLQVEEWQISDINRNKIKDENLTIPVLEAIRKVSKDHIKKQNKIRRLTAA